MARNASVLCLLLSLTSCTTVPVEEKSASLPELVAGLRNPDAEVRRKSAQALDALGSDALPAAPDVAGAMFSETNGAVIVAMGWALNTWSIDMSPVLPALRRALKDRDHTIRFEAALLGQNFMDATEFIPVYLDILGYPYGKESGNNPERRVQIVTEVDRQFDGLLMKTTRDTNDLRRAAAARLMMKLEPAPAGLVTRYTELLSDPVPEVRRPAAYGLMWNANEAKSSAPTLIVTLKDKDPETRENAAWALGRIGSFGDPTPGALDALAHALAHDAEADVRENAATAIGDYYGHATDYLPKLCAAFDPANETDTEVRAAAISALSNICRTKPAPPFVIEALGKAFTDREEMVIVRALATAGHLGKVSAPIAAEIARRTRPEYSKGIRLNAIGALRDIQEAARPYAAEVNACLHDPDPDIRDAAGSVRM